MFEREIPEICPQRIGRDVGNEHRLSGRGRSSAGSDIGADLDTVDRLVVSLWQTRRGTVQQTLAAFVEQQDRAEDPGFGMLLDRSD